VTTTHASRTAPRSATLIGIDAPEGFHCQDCSRELTARLFRVRVTATGEVRYLGRKCAARATGYPTTRLEHEARRRELLRLQDRRLAEGTVEEVAEHLRATQIVNRDDTIEWRSMATGEVVLVPVVEHAAAEHARLRSALAAGELD
jgi:hypothetical protein